MPEKVNSYTSFNDAIKLSPAQAVEMATVLFQGLPVDRQDTTLRGFVVESVKRLDDEGIPILLQMMRKLHEQVCQAEIASREDLPSWQRDRMADGEAIIRFRKYIAQLYWELPDKVTVQNPPHWTNWRDHHAEPALVDTKVTIFGELLCEWVAEPTDKSIHAFRRVIAMFCPPNAQRSWRNDGEQDVEFNARGRFVSDSERKQFLNLIRLHLDTFGFMKEKDPDCVFTPWLAQQSVPERILELLVKARAKMGGFKLAARDLAYAAVLKDIPSSGIALIATMTSKMRDHLGHAKLVLAEMVTKTRQRYPGRKGGDRSRDEIEFVDPQTITIRLREGEQSSWATTLGDASVAIEGLRASGSLTCAIWLEVCSIFRDDGIPLRRFWPEVK